MSDESVKLGGEGTIPLDRTLLDVGRLVAIARDGRCRRRGSRCVPSRGRSRRLARHSCLGAVFCQVEMLDQQQFNGVGQKHTAFVWTPTMAASSLVGVFGPLHLAALSVGLADTDGWGTLDLRQVTGAKYFS